MHEHSSESAFLVDAEVNPMGGAIDGRVGTSIMTSPCRAEIEKAQEEIRLEINCREQQLSEMEFLEKGGDPLDFKFFHAVSVSVQSTSLAAQHPNQIVNSKAKDSYDSAALRSQPSKALEVLRSPGDTTCEANSDDNLSLFDGENKLHKDKNLKGHPCKSKATLSDISKGNVRNDKATELENCAIFRPYARRNLSKSNRDGARLCSGDALHGRNQGSTQVRPGYSDPKGSVFDANGKDQKLPSVSLLKSSNRTSKKVQKNGDSLNVESIVASTAETPTNVHGNVMELCSDINSNGGLEECRQDHENPQGTTELANGASGLSYDPTAVQKADTPNQSDVIVIPKEINDPLLDSTTMNLGFQTPKKDRDTCSNPICEDAIEHSNELILVNSEGRKPVTEDPLETNINPEPVNTISAVIFDDRMHYDIKSNPVIEVEKDLDLQTKLVTSESLKTTESNEIQAMKNAGNMIEHKSSPINVEADVQVSVISPHDDVSKPGPSGGGTTDKDAPDNACSKKITDKKDEDSILAEAKLILAKHKRIADLSTKSLPLKNYQKSHWDFLLEEVAWLANDFMQERVWKVTAAAQLVRHSALSFHQRHQNQMPVRRLKLVASSLARAVMEFWHTCETLDTPVSLEPQSPHKSFALRSYTRRFLRNNSTTPSMKVEDPVTSSDMLDLGLLETSGESCITEDNLFYSIPTGSMQCYRTSIESYVLQCEKNGNMQKEEDALIHEINEGTMEMHQDYDEDERETSLQYIPGTVECSKSLLFPHMKKKGFKRTYSSGSYELGSDFAYGSHLQGIQKSVLVVKRSATQNLVSIPIKRMRTASRQRVLGSSSGAGTMNTLAMNKTDASSEDTNSYQEYQGSLHGGCHIQRSLEVESPLDYESYLSNDSEEISTEHKKRKKDKTTGDYSKWRLGSHHPGSSRSNGWFGDHKPKKLKISKQAFQNLLDNGGPISGSMPSPAASQMSNMSSANEYKRIIAYRDRFKKTKGTKLPIPVSGFGNAWTSFEDQALVVLVHDLGPNWDLVSDAINSTLQVKHIFREPKECRERHKLLMDQTPGDVADSADDSGSSQPYQSTIPGIPKGSARQLFQRLHGPMEEDLVKSHFEKIIMIGQRQYHRREQYDSHDQKHVAPPHNSHFVAISQVSSNDLNGAILTPLDLIDAIMPSSDALALGYHCPQTNGFTNQSCIPHVLPPPGMPDGSSISSPSGPNNHWSGRYRVSMPPLPTDEHQRVRQPNALLSGKNTQQSTTPARGPQPVSDNFGPRKLQGGNGTSMITGINNRGKPIPRPGFQGLGSSAIVDSTASLSSGVVGMQNLDMQSNSMHRQMDSSHHIRSLEYHGQKLVPEMQMRAAQANISCVALSSGLNGSYTGQTVPSPGQSYSAHPQQKDQKSLQQSHDLTNQHLKGPIHAIGSEHPDYARLIKERKLQQQIFQQQQQYCASNSMIQQAHQQLPVSMQNSSQVQAQFPQGVSVSSLSPPSSLAPINPQLQQKHHLPPHGVPRDSQSCSSSLPSRVPKQQQQHPQQQHQSVLPLTAQQRQPLQGKHIKGDGRGNMTAPVDQPNLNGQSVFSSRGGQYTRDVAQALQVIDTQSSAQLYRTQLLNPASQSKSQQVSLMLDNGNPLSTSHLVSTPNQPRLHIPANSHHKPVAQSQTQLNNTGGPENSPHLSQLDAHIVNKEAPTVSNASTTLQSCAELLDERSKAAFQQQTPESSQQQTSQSVYVGSPSAVCDSSPGSLRKKLSVGDTSSGNSVGERWQKKNQAPCPLSPSTSQRKECEDSSLPVF